MSYSEDQLRIAMSCSSAAELMDQAMMMGLFLSPAEAEDLYNQANFKGTIAGSKFASAMAEVDGVTNPCPTCGCVDAVQDGDDYVGFHGMWRCDACGATWLK